MLTETEGRPNNEAIFSKQERGFSWEYDRFRSMKTSRNRAWFLAIAMVIVASLSLLSMIIMLPLKEFQPYVITVDKSTGFIEITKGLKAGNLSQDEAITQSFLVQYITARESYLSATVKDNYRKVELFSEGNALRSYRSTWTRSNPDNPAVIYGDKTEVAIQIKSVAFLNDTTASIRFLRKQQSQNGMERITHYVATIGFKYVERPEKTENRFINPLGFLVNTYRLDQEVLEN